MHESTEQNWPEGRIVDRLPVIVFGHSMGGLIALNFVQRHSRAPNPGRAGGVGVEESGEEGIWGAVVIAQERRSAG